MKLLELFSGSGSIGKVFKQSFEVTSLDSDPKARATITCDILDWDYEVYEPGHFDVIWASPPCTEFSVLKTSGTRDFAKADGIVRRTLAIIDYSRPRLFFCENPQTGLLKTRPYMQGLPSVTLDYCKYGTPYRKRTQVWTNCSYWTPRPLCRRDCGHVIPGTWAHEFKTQRVSTKTLQTIPRELVEEIYVVCTLRLDVDFSDN